MLTIIKLTTIAYSMLFTPLGESFNEATYYDFLHSNSAIVSVWCEQIDAFTDEIVAEECHFHAIRQNDHTLLITYDRFDKHLWSKLVRLGSDARVDNITPVVSSPLLLTN